MLFALAALRRLVLFSAEVPPDDLTITTPSERGNDTSTTTAARRARQAVNGVGGNFI
jgi:hypothetical protein